MIQAVKFIISFIVDQCFYYTNISCAFKDENKRYISGGFAFF